MTILLLSSGFELDEASGRVIALFTEAAPVGHPDPVRYIPPRTFRVTLDAFQWASKDRLPANDVDLSFAGPALTTEAAASFVNVSLVTQEPISPLSTPDPILTNPTLTNTEPRP